jgi:uncharacterized protein (TIGR02996 family)
VSAITAVLTQAATDAKSGHLEAAQASLLLAWTKVPAEELREVILAIDDVLTPTPFAGSTEAWVLAVKKAKPGKRGALIAALKGPKLADVVHRFETAATWGSDPRVSRVLERVLTEMPWTSDSSKPAWNAVFAAVAASKDPRFVELLATLPRTWKVREGIKGWLDRAFARAVEALPREAPSLETSDAKVLSQVNAALGSAPRKPTPAAPGRDEAELLADIYANPRDDAARLVYADVLQEKGDPRGEFIALQCAGTTGNKVNALLKAHQKEWLGPLATVLGAKVEFRRGFPAVGMAKFRHQADAEKYGNLREWSTFEELTWSGASPPTEQIPYCRWAGPSMRWLERAQGVHVPHLLGAALPWPNLEELETRFASPAELVRFLEVQPRQCPKLHTLLVPSMPAEYLKNVTSFGTIKVLSISPRNFAPALTRASALGVDELRIGEAITLRRGADGHLSAATIHLHQRGMDWLIKEMPDGLLESVTFEVVEGGPDAAIEASARAKVRPPGAKSGYLTAQEKAAGPQVVNELRNVYALAALPDGTVLIVEPDQLLFVDPATRVVKHATPTAGASQAVVYANGTRALLANDKRLTVVDLTQAGAELFSVQAKSPVRGLELSGDERVVSIGGGGVTFDLQTRKEVDGPRGAGRAFLMSPEGDWWARHGAVRGTVEIMRPGRKNGVLLEKAEGLDETVIAQGALFGRTTEHLLKWDPDTGKALLTLKLEAGQGLFRSPYGRWLATREGKTVTVIDAATLTKVRTVTPSGWVNCVGFMPDGKVLVAGRTLEVL